METTEAIATVITIREFDQTKKVGEDTIKKILDAGRLAPSARNQQPWYFIAVSDRELLQKIASLSKTGRHIANSSFAIAVVTDTENRWNIIDATRAVENMTIQAWALGLGSCWVGTIEKDLVKEILNIPKNLDILTILPFGYPTKKYVGKKNRKPFDQVAYFNSYGRAFAH